MDYTAVTRPAYADADKAAISCMVVFKGMDAPAPFTAHANDPEEHGQKLYAELTELKYGQIAPYAAPPQTEAEQYAAAIAAGLLVVSGSTPALNATYEVDPAATADILFEATFITLYQEFTNGQQTFGWPDAAGVLRTFPSPAIFLQFSKAAAVYVSGCKQAYAALIGGAAADFPGNVAVIG